METYAEVFSNDELLDLSKGGVVKKSVTIRGGIDVITDIKTIKGELGITQRDITSLGSIEEVKGNLWVSIYDTPCKLSSIGNLKKVDGDINLKACIDLDSLGNLEYVGGTLNIRNTRIRTLGTISVIKGDAHLPIEMKSEPLDKIHIYGKVRYWKHQDQYTPVQNRPANLIELRRQELAEGKESITGEIAVRFGHISEFTSFGRSNIDKIYPYIEREIEMFVKERGASSFLDIFFDGIHPYKKNSRGRFDNEYYRTFFKTKESFEFYASLFSSTTYKCDDNRFSLVFEHAISEQLSKFFRPAEDAYRVHEGIPKIGEGWISETDLFYKIKNHFANHVVIQHGRPSWLGKQHLDIYFPNENIAIEYQGAQHYKPIDIFGGTIHNFV